jgi:hypothetical protein
MVQINAIAPGVYSYLDDQSEFSPDTVATGPAMIAPIFTKRGEDRVIKYKTTLRDLRDEFGTTPDYKYSKDLAHGSVEKWMSSGLPSYVCRLTADNAVKAFRFLGIKVKAAFNVATHTAFTKNFYETGKAYATNSVVNFGKEFYIATGSIVALEEKQFNSTGKWKQAYQYSTTDSYVINDYVTRITTGTKVELFKATANSASPAGAFVDGNWSLVATLSDVNAIFDFVLHDGTDTSVVNIGKFKANGAGADYNGMYLTLSKNGITSSEVGAPVLTYQVTDHTTGGDPFTLLRDTADFSFAEISDSQESLFATDIFERYSQNVDFEYLLTGTQVAAAELTKLISVSAGYFMPAGDTTLENLMKFDIFDGLVGKKVILANGSDGSLFVNNKIVPAVRDDLIIRFYQGTIDSKLLDPKAVPAYFVFDLQGSNLTVSNTINDFTKYLRPHIFAYQVGKDCLNETEQLDFRNKSFTVDNRNSSLRAGWVTHNDPYTLSDIRVPTFYLMIAQLSKSIKENGMTKVHGGYDDEGSISGYKADTLTYSPSPTYQDSLK